MYSGPITFSVPYDSDSPREFDYQIPFQSNFFYNPSRGGLVVDIEVIRGETDASTINIPTLDYTRSASSFGAVLNYSSSWTGYANPTGISEFGQGDIVQLTYANAPAGTPEPASMLLSGSGVFLPTAGKYLTRRFTAGTPAPARPLS